MMRPYDQGCSNIPLPPLHGVQELHALFYMTFPPVFGVHDAVLDMDLVTPSPRSRIYKASLERHFLRSLLALHNIEKWLRVEL